MPERIENVGGWSWGPQPATAHPNETGTANTEALKLLDRDTLNLGDLNPLIHATDLTRRESVDAVRLTILDEIKAHKGLEPQVLESAAVYEAKTGGTFIRFIARFEVPKLTKRQMFLLEQLVRQTYGISVRTTKDSKGNDIPAEDYPPTQRGEELKSKAGGWYMGPNTSPTTSAHMGLFVFKDMGQVNKDNFLDSSGASLKYIVEIREAEQYQTDLVTFVTQVSSILGKRKLLDEGQLVYETYYNLIRLGLKNTSADSIYGMSETLRMIKRGLLIPLASPELSRGIKEDPQSVLMIGVPGTGKTLIVEQLLNEETGLFILPIDPLELLRELAKKKEEQRLLPRIAQIARITGRQVILHVDDIENMVEGDRDTHSTMLNLMAGVRESGFHIIASTNNPEKIDQALLQPQRFGILIYCGLQNEAARFEILKIHANMLSEGEAPLFLSQEERDIILQEVAAHTEHFTPRYIADITTSAKAFLTERVAKSKGKTIGLKETDLEGFVFTLEDWEKAFIEVSSKYDRDSVKKRDEQLEKFVHKHSRGNLGFRMQEGQNGVIFSSDARARLAALGSRSEITDNKSVD